MPPLGLRSGVFRPWERFGDDGSDDHASANSGAMAQSFSALSPKHTDFIARQRIFFIASAAAGTRVNVSPKPADAVRVIDANTVIYLDLTGSGNETAAHVFADGALTFMFCAFEGPPSILRLFGKGRVLRRDTEAYAALLGPAFAGVEPPGARQMVRLDVDLVRTSCGFGVPLFAYAGERDTLTRWATAKGEAALRDYRRTKNMESLDGFPTGLEDAAAPAHAGRS
jgi:hypothetical protein